MELSIFLWVFLVIILVDGIKIFIETLSKREKLEIPPNTYPFSVVIPVYNDPVVASTLLSCIDLESQHAKQIILVDDCSKEDMLDVVASLPEVTNASLLEHDDEKHIYTVKIKNSDIEVLFIKLHKNVGKVTAINKGLEYVTYDYTFLVDSDTEIVVSNMPVSLLATGEADAIAFNVSPMPIKTKNIFKKVLHALQTNEYGKSMLIGKVFASKTRSVECVSGASGLFKTKRLLEQIELHTGVFAGEDLERTLIELFLKGRVIFVNENVHTEVPTTLKGFLKQRVFGWWPGLWHKLPMSIRLLFGRNVSIRLRHEMAYLLYTLVTDPIKILSVWVLALTGTWSVLALVYLLYVGLELLVYRRVKYYLYPVFLMPFYTLLQMHLRIAAFFVWIKQRFIKSAWKPTKRISISMFLGLFIALSASAQGEYTLDYKANQIIDLPDNQRNIHHELYLGYSPGYVQFTYTHYTQMNVGAYLGNWHLDLGIRDNNRLLGFARYEHWVGNYTARVGARYGYTAFGQSAGYGVPSIMVGAGYYSVEPHTRLNTVYTLDFIQDLARYKTITAVANVRASYGIIRAQSHLAANELGHYNYGMLFGVSIFYVNADYHNNFDFTGIERLYVGGGIHVRF